MKNDVTLGKNYGVNLVVLLIMNQFFSFLKWHGNTIIYCRSHCSMSLWFIVIKVFSFVKITQHKTNLIILFYEKQKKGSYHCYSFALYWVTKYWVLSLETIFVSLSSVGYFNSSDFFTKQIFLHPSIQL